MIRPYSLVIFDWDGTLVDSIDCIVDCTVAALRDLGVEDLPVARIREAIGLGLGDTIDHFFPAPAALQRQLVERYKHHWRTGYRERWVPMAGAAETLTELRQRGYLLGLATAKSRRGLDQDLRRSGLEPLFHATRTADEAQPKPHPAMVGDLMSQLAVSPADTLMVGDTVYDVEMATRAGASAVAVTSGSQNRRALESSRPLVVLDGVHQLVAWLDRIGAAAR